MPVVTTEDIKPCNSFVLFFGRRKKCDFTFKVSSRSFIQAVFFKLFYDEVVDFWLQGGSTLLKTQVLGDLSGSKPSFQLS